MKWHKGDTTPVIDDGKECYCVVQFNSEAELNKEYETVCWISNKHSFVLNGRNLIQGVIKRWAYVEEDDDVYQEQDALTAIYEAIKHVRSLFDCLLTDGMNCGKEYRDLVGLNELDVLQEKVSKRILYLDSLG